MQRLAIITTHPIQYYAPLFKQLNERGEIIIKVFYTWGSKASGGVFDPGFGKSRQWDVPLLEGYEYEFVENISMKPGSHHFRGIINPTLISKIIEWKTDAVLVIGWKFRSHLKAMFHFKGKIPVLFYGDSTLLDEPEGFSLKKILRRLSLRLIYSYIDYALYTGTNSKAYFSSSGVRKKKLIFAPHAIDNVRFNYPDRKYNDEAIKWKEELNVPLDKTVVLFAGKLESKKNPLFLVEAAIKFPALHFIIVGNGELELIIAGKARYLKNLTLLPFQNQSKMPVVYRLADIFVLPSKGPGETWGLALNEAMASGRMVIASNKCGGAIDLIKNGVNGFIIKAEEADFFKTLLWVEKSPAEISLLKKKSTELIKDFTFEKISTAIEVLLNHTIGAKYSSN